MDGLAELSNAAQVYLCRVRMIERSLSQLLKAVQLFVWGYIPWIPWQYTSREISMNQNTKENDKELRIGVLIVSIKLV
jgi:hypothetical protein